MNDGTRHKREYIREQLLKRIIKSLEETFPGDAVWISPLKPTTRKSIMQYIELRVPVGKDFYNVRFRRYTYVNQIVDDIDISCGDITYLFLPDHPKFKHLKHKMRTLFREVFVPEADFKQRTNLNIFLEPNAEDLEYAAENT